MVGTWQAENTRGRGVGTVPRWDVGWSPRQGSPGRWREDLLLPAWPPLQPLPSQTNILSKRAHGCLTMPELPKHP